MTLWTCLAVPASIIAIIFFFSLLASIRIVQQNHLQLVERLGQYKRTLTPGLHILVPFIERAVVDINLAFQNQVFDVDTVSKDKVIVRLKSNLIFAVDPASVTEYHYKLANPIATLSSFIENYMRSFVAAQTHEELLEKREELSEYLIQHLGKKMAAWGITISSIQVMDISFPNAITDAMSKVVASQRLKEAAMNEAEAQKIRVVKQAEAEKESRILLGEGVAGERRAIVDGLRASIDDMSAIKDLKTDEVMNLVVVSQYFDTIKAIGDAPNSKVLFLNPAPQGANDLIQNLATAIESTKDDEKKKK